MAGLRLAFVNKLDADNLHLQTLSGINGSEGTT